MIEKFIEYLKYEKNFSKHTLTSYRNDLEQFAAYLQHAYEDEKPEKAESFMVRSWLAELMEEKVSARSVVRKASTLRTYYRYLMREGAIKTTPMAKVNTPKIPSRLPVFVSPKDMNTLFTRIPFTDDFNGVRNRLILEMFYSTGIRLSELMTLKDTDTDTAGRTIKVFGKRSKERIIPIPDTLKDSIEAYRHLKSKITILTARPGGQNLKLNETFFITDKGNPLYEKQVYLIVKKYLGEVTTLQKKSPHVLRHTFATHILDNGADINAVKEVLGHANLSATQVYTHNTLEKLKRVYKQSHPRG